MTIEYCRLKPISIATDTELAQAYSQGYQDGRRALSLPAVDRAIHDTLIEQAQTDRAQISELIAALRDLTSMHCMQKSAPGSPAIYRDHIGAMRKARAALAKVAQPQPATKGE